MDETEELIRLCVRALVAQMIAAPGIELHVTRSCVLGLTPMSKASSFDRWPGRRSGTGRSRPS
jgi:hypothetical protein